VHDKPPRLQHSMSNAYGALVTLAERIAAIEQRFDER
jgi:hypothetical protein